MSKFIVNKLRRKMEQFKRFLPDDRDKAAHVLHVEGLLEGMGRRRGKRREDLLRLFGPQKSNKRSRWALRRREFLQGTLLDLRELVLENNHVRPSEKVAHLYAIRVYQWRLNNESLVGNFN